MFIFVLLFSSFWSPIHLFIWTSTGLSYSNTYSGLPRRRFQQSVRKQSQKSALYNAECRKLHLANGTTLPEYSDNTELSVASVQGKWNRYAWVSKYILKPGLLRGFPEAKGSPSIPGRGRCQVLVWLDWWEFPGPLSEPTLHLQITGGFSKYFIFRIARRRWKWACRKTVSMWVIQFPAEALYLIMGNSIWMWSAGEWACVGST